MINSLNSFSFKANNISPKNKQKDNNEQIKFESKLNAARKEGFILGIALAGSLGLAETIKEHSDKKFIMNDIKEELQYGKPDSVYIEDITGDKNPDIILKATDGMPCTYDLYSGKIYYGDKKENLVEKIK